MAPFKVVVKSTGSLLLLSCAKKKKKKGLICIREQLIFLLKMEGGRLGFDPSEVHLKFVKIVTFIGLFVGISRVCPKYKMQLRIPLFAEINTLTV